MPDECDHPIDETFWYTMIGSDDRRRRATLNEDGWHCLDCGDLGYRPDFDRDRIEMKAHNILLDFHEAGLIYISNGTMGEVIGNNVANRCRETGLYDQYSILRYIMEDPNMSSHAPFWQNRAERFFLNGEPIRDDQEALPF